MIYLRKANERGHANHGWLDSWHTFSFANYYDPNFMGFSALRVINDDVIEAGQGFGTHPHKDMEILTYVLEGTVEHQDSMGNKEQVPAGEFQIMSAGTGIVTQSTTQAAPSVCICIRSGSCLKKTVLRRVMNSVASMPYRANSWCSRRMREMVH